MVTRTVILVTASEAAAFAATSTLSSSSSAAAAESIISNAPLEQINLDEELQTYSFNYPSYTKRAQDPSPGGLVQLCRQKGCFHAVDFERRSGGLCCIHQKGPMDGDQSDSDDSEDDGKIGVTADKNCLDEFGKKRDCPSADSISGKDDIKRQRVDAFVLDLTDVPPQSPIPKSSGRVKEGASKYKGISFNKQTNKWHAQIMIAGKSRFIGSYEIEEEAAGDNARAVFKFNGQGALDKAREAKEENSFAFDLSDVPPQLPIPKCAGHIKEGASKYKGVSFNKPMNKWHARIHIDGKERYIGRYENEEEAAVDYARAVFKYRGQGALDKVRERRALDKSGELKSFIIDLTNVPLQSPIPKIEGRIKGGASKYTGVYFNKPMKKWHAQISIDGKQRHIGYYDNEEEAAADYARAVFKYKGQGALEKARETPYLTQHQVLHWSTEENSFIIYLTGVPPQQDSEDDGEIRGVTSDEYCLDDEDEGLCDRHSTHHGNNNYGLDEVGKKHDRPLEDSISGKDDIKRQRVDAFIIDLTGVPPQPPIPRSVGYIKEGASKYKGVSFNKPMKKWHARIHFDGKHRHIVTRQRQASSFVAVVRLDG